MEQRRNEKEDKGRGEKSERLKDFFKRAVNGSIWLALSLNVWVV